MKNVIVVALGELLGIDTPFSVDKLRQVLTAPHEIGTGKSATLSSDGLARLFTNQATGQLDPTPILREVAGVTAGTLQLQVVDNRTYTVADIS